MAALQCDVPLMSDVEFKHWQDMLGQREEMNPLQSELNRLVRIGVPRGLRATVWPVLLRVSKSQSFVPCMQSAHSVELIEHDLPRTFPTREAVQNVAFRELLRDTLLQLHIPYQQGLSLVAATLLSHVARDDAVRCLYALLSNSLFGLSSIFVSSESVVALQSISGGGSGGTVSEAMPPQWLAGFQRVFGTLLPGVYACLGAQGVDASMVVCKWLRTAFAEVLPEPVLLRVWDCYFLHGLGALLVCYTFHSIAVANAKTQLFVVKFRFRSCRFLVSRCGGHVRSRGGGH